MNFDKVELPRETQSCLFFVCFAAKHVNVNDPDFSDFYLPFYSGRKLHGQKIVIERMNFSIIQISVIHH